MTSKGDRGETGRDGRDGTTGVTGTTGAGGQRGPAGAAGKDYYRVERRFDWTHLVAYMLLAAAFIWTARENRQQGELIGRQSERAQVCVNELRGDLRQVLRDQIELRALTPQPDPDKVIDSLERQITRLENSSC